MCATTMASMALSEREQERVDALEKVAELVEPIAEARARAMALTAEQTGYMQAAHAAGATWTQIQAAAQLKSASSLERRLKK